MLSTPADSSRTVAGALRERYLVNACTLPGNQYAALGVVEGVCSARHSHSYGSC